MEVLKLECYFTLTSLFFFVLRPLGPLDLNPKKDLWTIIKAVLRGQGNILSQTREGYTRYADQFQTVLCQECYWQRPWSTTSDNRS